MPANGYTDTPHEPDGRFAEALAAARELAADVAALKQATEEPLTDALAQFLASQYVLATRAAVRQASGGSLDLNTLRPLCLDVVALRRGDQAADRLRLDRERFEEEVRERRAADEAAKREANRPKGIRPETLRKIEEELKLL